MADSATLITHLRYAMQMEQAAVVAFGGSYGGMLAAWLRMKFPWIIQVCGCTLMLGGHWASLVM